MVERLWQFVLTIGFTTMPMSLRNIGNFPRNIALSPDKHLNNYG